MVLLAVIHTHRHHSHKKPSLYATNHHENPGSHVPCKTEAGRALYDETLLAMDPRHRLDHSESSEAVTETRRPHINLSPKVPGFITFPTCHTKGAPSFCKPCETCTVADLAAQYMRVQLEHDANLSDNFARHQVEDSIAAAMCREPWLES